MKLTNIITFLLLSLLLGFAKGHEELNNVTNNVVKTIFNFSRQKEENQIETSRSR